VSFEYVEDWADLDNGWDELLNGYAEDGWQLKFILVDEGTAEGRKPGRRRLIFERSNNG